MEVDSLLDWPVVLNPAVELLARIRFSHVVKFDCGILEVRDDVRYSEVFIKPLVVVRATLEREIDSAWLVNFVTDVVTKVLVNKFVDFVTEFGNEVE